MDQVRAAERVPAPAISSLIEDALVAVGLPAADAAKVAELMTEADLTGADAHGVFRLPQYVRRLRAGGVNRKPDIRVTRTAPATALVDGDNGMGHLVMARAAETAIELARAAGVGWVGARRSNHAGSAGVYAALPLAARHDRHLFRRRQRQPHGALGRRRDPARHQSAGGRDPGRQRGAGGARHRHHGGLLRHGQGLPPAGQGDAGRLDGEPRGRRAAHRSARTAPTGLLLPIGGYKGSGLAIVLGLLAGTLNGAAFGRDVIDFNYDDESACDNGHFIVALDVARFVPLATFTAEVDRHVRDLRGSQRLPGFDAIRLPGEQRRTRREDRARNGVPMAPELLAQLDKLAGELGVKRLGER